MHGVIWRKTNGLLKRHDGRVAEGFSASFVNDDVVQYSMLRPFFVEGISPCVRKSMYPALSVSIGLKMPEGTAEKRSSLNNAYVVYCGVQLR